MLRAAIVVFVVLAAAPGFAQQGVGNECTPAGTWYGGSLTAYQMTIVPSVPAGHYTVTFQPFYKNSVINVALTGTLEKKGDAYEGSILALTSQDPAFLNPPPAGTMPDLSAGWVSMRMADCNTINNVVPMYGLYFAASVWAPAIGGPTWTNIKKPLIDPPDVDLLEVIAGGYPILETYKRLPNSVNPTLLHK
ncbi:MAG: hypothetical protein ACM3NQ_20755 [Bacteroidales bacterium]